MRQFIAIAAVSTLLGCQRGAESFEDCVLEKVKAGTSDSVAAALVQACSIKYPKKPQIALPLDKLPDDQKRQVAVTFSLPCCTQTAQGHVHNGTDSWLVRQVHIVIAKPGAIQKASNPASSPLTALDAKFERYSIDVEVPPYHSKDYRLTVAWPYDQPFEWGVLQVSGIAAKVR